MDFYDVNWQYMDVIMGHYMPTKQPLTFYPGAGFETLRPIEFDYEMGGWLHLEDIHRS